ncbi:MAG: phage tail spike protein, partial [Cellulosilyticum sp.]|nr:phage tail spike protein [Cellulosilyticum sp.]
MAKLSMKVCKLDKTPICELLDNTPLRARNINENFAINEVTTLSFDLPVVKDGKWKNVSNETLIFFNDEYYNVKSLQFTHSKEGQLLLHVEAKHLSEILASQLISVEETTPRNIIELLKIALLYDENGVSQTGWTVGDIDVDKVKTRGLEANEQSPFSIILTIVEKWDAIAIFDSKTMKVNVIPTKSTEHPSLDLRVSKNLQEVTITYDTSEICTRLYGYGKQDDDGNDLDIMSVNPTGKPYVDNFDYFVNKGYTLEYIEANPQMFVRTNIYREESIYDAQDLYNNTVAELQKVSQPKVDVQIQALNTKRIRANNIVNVGLGDCVLVHDEELGMSFVCNVIKKSVDYENPHLLNVELVNSIQYRDIIAELFNNVSNVSSIVHSGNIVGTTSMEDVQNYLNLYYLSTEQLDAKYIDAETIKTEYLDAEEIKTQYLDAEAIGAKYATITELKAVEATIEDLEVTELRAQLATVEELVAKKATIEDLDAAEADIETLKAGNATITGKLSTVEAEIDNLEATKASVGDFNAYKATVENLIADKATIEDLEATNATIENLDTLYAKITDLDATNINVEKLTAKDAEIEELVAKKATIEELNATKATITTLQSDLVNTNKLVAEKVDADYVEAEIVEANKVITDDITAIQGEITNFKSDYATIDYVDAEIVETEKLIAKKATIEELNAAKGYIASLEGNVANITSIMAGNIGTGSLQAINITGKNVVFEDAVIKSSYIDRVDTNVVTVGNEHIILAGSSQQFKDADGNVRVQIGQDAQGNFNFIISDEDGATIIDADGVTTKAIPDGLIIDDMISENAGIQASKIRYINFDGDTTLQTIITQQQGEISDLIKETTIPSEDGTTISLKDAYNETVKTVQGNTTTIANVQTSIDTLDNSISSMDSRITEIQATADGILTKVSAIGGQNLFYASTKEWIDKTNSEDYIFIGCYKEETDNDMEGRNVTLSVEIKTDNTTTGTFDICYYGVDVPTENDIHTLYTNIPLTELVNDKYVKTFVYPTTAPLVANQDGTMPTFTMVVRAKNITGTFSVRKGMLQYGQLATEWQPSSDNVSESVSIAKQDASKIYWLVRSGTDETNFELTPRTANLVANEINLKGLVTFSGLNSDVPNQILEPLA